MDLSECLYTIAIVLLNAVLAENNCPVTATRRIQANKKFYLIDEWTE